MHVARDEARSGKARLDIEWANRPTCIYVESPVDVEWRKTSEADSTSVEGGRIRLVAESEWIDVQ